MSSDFSYKNNLRKEFFFLFFLYLTLLLSFILGENSTGGAKIDFPVNKQLIFDFSENLIGTLLSYNEYDHRHSPVFLILLSYLSKLYLPNIKTFLCFFIISLSVSEKTFLS